MNFQEGQSLSRRARIIANALARFRLVDSDQKDYQGVDTLITETIEKQRKAVENAHQRRAAE